jgi:hypothetical protein
VIANQIIVELITIVTQLVLCLILARSLTHAGVNKILNVLQILVNLINALLYTCLHIFPEIFQMVVIRIMNLIAGRHI